ncbi:hypothetical protein F3D3_0609 [Fusibacter sp. 3D3]|nr:hypothetical protein F3D3_0609 [Fusibacter sp. 3D3]
MRSGIEFEVIQSSKVAAFLKRDKAMALDSQDESYIDLLNHYLEHGADHEMFYQKKLAYFGNEETIYYLTIWFDVPAEAEQIVITDWYLLVEGGNYDYQLVPFMGDEPIAYGKCSIYLANQQDRETLNKLMSIRSLEGKNVNANRALNGEWIQAIDQNTLFWGATVYYVGAALCVGLLSAAYSVALGCLVPHQTEAYFDFGYKSGNNSGNAYVRANSNKAVANLAIISQDLINTPAKTVILSHWHNDHICLVRQINGNHNYDAFWAQSTWLVPQTAAPVANIVAHNLNLYGGTMTVLPNVYPANNQVYNVYNNPNLILGKIDAFDPALLAGRHPHHHGIYARINLINSLNVLQYQQMLLVGDCTYSGIPNVQKNDCAYLQVCHHGGDYALPPCAQNPVVNSLYIPTPKNDPNYRYAFYSANGVTHGHPNANIMGRHNAMGWTAPWRTDRALTGRLVVTYNHIYDV